MSIAAQVVILFLVVLVGVLCRRLGYFTDETIRGVTQLVVNVTLPVLTVYNMQRPFDMHVLMNFLLTLLISLFSDNFTPKTLVVINKVCGVIIVFYGCKLLYSFLTMVF